MKRLIFLFAAGVVALALILILMFPLLPSLVVDLLRMPAALPTPPNGFDVRREGIDRGKVETVEYNSKVAWGKRKMCVYTPPGFSKDQKYPVLYLLHGAASDETGWVKDGAADTILDNLYEDKKPVPMIVVMPNGNLPTDALGTDLLDDVIPYVEKHFPVKADREHRALAGVSGALYRRLTSGPPTRTRLPTSASSSAAWITATGSRRSTKRCSRIWGRKETEAALDRQRQERLYL